VPILSSKVSRRDAVVAFCKEALCRAQLVQRAQAARMPILSSSMSGRLTVVVLRQQALAQPLKTAKPIYIAFAGSIYRACVAHDLKESGPRKQHPPAAAVSGRRSLSY
jgi:hypothetical protein